MQYFKKAIPDFKLSRERNDQSDVKQKTSLDRYERKAF
jgi:hypothetical protein